MPPSVAALRDRTPPWRDRQARAVLPLLLLVTCMGMGSAMVTTSVSLVLSKPDVPPLVVQAVLTAYPIGFLAGCLIARPLVARFGHARSFALITVVAAIASAGFLLTGFKPAWCALRIAGGISMAAMFVVCESWMNLYAQAHNRGRLFSLYMFATAAAVLCGQLMLTAIGTASTHGFAIASVIVLAAALGTLAIGPWPPLAQNAGGRQSTGRPAKGQRYGILQLFRIAPVTVVAIFQSGVTNLNVFVLTPLYAAEIGLTPSQALALVTTVSIAGMLAQTPVGWLSDRLDRRLILLTQGVLAASLCLAIAWLGARSLPALFVLFFVYGSIVLTVYPVAIAFANAKLPSRHMVSASGALLFLYSIGNIATPGLAARLMERTLPQAMLFFLGTGGLLVAIAAAANLVLPPRAVPDGEGAPE